MTEEPKYENYTFEQLLDAFDNINKEKYADRYKRLKAEIEKRKIELENNKKENNQAEVDYNDLPSLYSKQVINVFSILFSVIVGAILFVQNLHEIGKGNKHALWIVLSAFAYFCFGAIIIVEFKINTFSSLLLNGSGALIINYVLWDKLIGENIKYKKKAFWKPLLICIIIFIPLILVILFVLTSLIKNTGV